MLGAGKTRRRQRAKLAAPMPVLAVGIAASLVLSACGASCNAKSGETASACQSRMADQAQFRSESRTYGR